MTVMRASAYAPASVGNVGVGFDLLGLALDGPGDTVTAQRREDAKVVIDAIDGVTVELPREPHRNTAGRVALEMIDELGLDFGVTLTIKKGIALGSGMGGSAASAVASAVAINALLTKPLTRHELLQFALKGEAVASGAIHADNVAPSLYGGLILAPAESSPVRIPSPTGLRCVLARPALEINTRDGRAALRSSYALGEWVRQAGHLAAFVAACYRDDTEAVGRHLVDTLIEAQRKPAIRGFDSVRDAVLGAGALACTISGSGPAMFAWCRDADAVRVDHAFERAFAAAGLPCERVNSSLDAPGAKVIEAVNP
ncbi:MAG: homoserine kinase [Gammaproteobacteria bacterium]